jgi:molybdopterin molybdotransferase
MQDTHDCSGHGGPPLLTKQQALDLLMARATPIADTESVGTIEALGRVLAEPVTSPIDVPAWDNSAVDGYALRRDDVSAPRGRLPITQRIPAGTAGTPLEPGTAARIFTGAPVPQGADTVVMQEVCSADDGWVEVPADIATGANIRRRGEDIAAGAEVIGRGTRLAPQHLGLAASIGASHLKVFRRLRVAIFSTGDELVAPGNPLEPGQIYNSNRFTLTGLLQGLGCEIVDLGTAEDSLEATVRILEHGAAEADLILGSGGVSVGDEDYVKTAIERLGTLELWSVAIRPGKPLAFGLVAGTPFLGSPGNPVSLFATFCLFARPFLLRMQGVEGELAPRAHRVRAGFDWPRPDKRREFQRARLVIGEDGVPTALVYPSRSSGVLSSVTWADGFVEIPESQVITQGDPIDFIPFDGLLH